MKRLILILLILFTTYAQAIDFSEYDRILKKYVDDFGRVNYKSLQKNDQAAITELVQQIASKNPLMKPASYPTRNHKMAAWINIYNILVLNEVILHYPIESIQDIPNVWKKKQNLGTFKHSLDDIEHDLLSKAFNEPRIHFALICAAYSCPRLQRFSFSGPELEYQFKTVSTEFFRNPLTFSFYKKDNKILISKLFEWYINDFLYAPNNKDVKQLVDTKDVILNYVIKNGPAEITDYIQQNRDKIQVDIMIWHWRLNESFN